ncbi:hypothetical protein J2T14_001914 [Paenibacillus harenae]|nr:hypothetical protein [Paenibacillus harenae]
MIINSILSSINYRAGTREKREVYKDVIESAIAATRPNMNIRLNSNTSSLLGIKYYGDMVKQVGDERVGGYEYNDAARLAKNDRLE